MMTAREVCLCHSGIEKEIESLHERQDSSEKKLDKMQDRLTSTIIKVAVLQTIITGVIEHATK